MVAPKDDIALLPGSVFRFYDVTSFVNTPVLDQNPDSQPKKRVSKEQKINESESDLWVPGNFLRSPEERLSRPGEP